MNTELCSNGYVSIPATTFLAA